MSKKERIERAVVDFDGEWPSKFMADPGCVLEEYLSPNVWTVSRDREADHTCTYPEFMEARKRLENKPSWHDAPEWAEWLAQDSDGLWFWASTEPGHFTESPDTEWDVSECRDFTWATDCGHIFTDWRQSLEPRPESKPDQETLNPEAQQAEAWLKVCEALTRIWPDWLDLDSRAEDCAVIAIERLADRSPSANNEHHDHKEGEGVKWDPGVDLPPVGEVVEIVPDYSHEVFDWFIGKSGVVVAHDRIEDFDAAVVKVEDEEIPCFRYHSFSAKCFARPKSHRDKVIEAADEVWQHSSSKCTHESFVTLAGDLYDAGLLNDKRGDQ